MAGIRNKIEVAAGIFHEIRSPEFRTHFEGVIAWSLTQ